MLSIGKPKTNIDSTISYSNSSENESLRGSVKVKWYHSTFYNTTILGLCNFLSPGLWGAMNSLGAGGLEKPYLVNASNALTFGLMFLTCFAGSALVRIIGVRQVLSFGCMGYAPYAAALYCNSRYGVEWFVIFGSALCGLTAGLFWMSEAAVALSYPEPERKGKLIAYWLCYRVGGQLVGGAINLGVNAHDNHAGGISYKVYIVFITLQGLGPFVAFLLNSPEKVERRDGKKVRLVSDPSIIGELKETLKFFLRKEFLLILPLIAQAVYSEAFNNTYLASYFTVRSRALGSFLSAVCCMISGFFLGFLLDNKTLLNKKKARWGFIGVQALQAGIWIWSTVNQQQYTHDKPTFDWNDSGFGKAFGLYIFMAINFQLNYMYLYYAIGNLANSPQEIIRLSALLRGTESASQTVSYGLNSVQALTTIGNSAINFGLWGISIIPASLVIWRIGTPGGFGAIESTIYVEDPHPESPHEKDLADEQAHKN